MDPAATTVDRHAWAPTADEAELLRAWGHGDRRAGEQLIRLNLRAVKRYAASRHPDPADLIQRVFLACLEARGRFAEIRSFRAFLVGIARNIVARDVRKQVRFARAIRRATAAESAVPVSASPDIEAHDRRALQRAVATLPGDLRHMLQLHYWDGMRTRDIGLALGIPHGTVLSRLHRSRKLLRRAMDS